VYALINNESAEKLEDNLSWI